MTVNELYSYLYTDDGRITDHMRDLIKDIVPKVRKWQKERNKAYQNLEIPKTDAGCIIRSPFVGEIPSSMMVGVPVQIYATTICKHKSRKYLIPAPVIAGTCIDIGRYVEAAENHYMDTLFLEIEDRLIKSHMDKKRASKMAGEIIEKVYGNPVITGIHIYISNVVGVGRQTLVNIPLSKKTVDGQCGFMITYTENIQFREILDPNNEKVAASVDERINEIGLPEKIIPRKEFKIGRGVYENTIGCTCFTLGNFKDIVSTSRIPEETK